MRQGVILKILLLIIIFIIISGTQVFSDENDIIQEQINSIDTEELQKFADNINNQTSTYMPELNVKQMIYDIFKGNPLVNLKNIFSEIIRYFIREITYNLGLLIKIIVLSIFCAVLQNLHGAFEKDTIGKLAYSICYVLIVIMMINSFHVAMEIGGAVIDSMVTFIQSLLPMLLALLVAVGGITSSTVFQPIIFASISVITTLVKAVIVPMIYFSAVLSILNNLSDTVHISKLASLIKQTAIGMLGFMLTVFLGILSVQGVASSSLDSVSIKTAKFAVDNFVPIVGKFLTDAFDTVISCSVLIKNGVGAVGLLMLVLICCFPLVKMLSIILIYKISSALIQPILDNQIVQCINDMSNSLLIMMACVIGVGVLFFMSITVIMGVGNMTVMMR